jgi:hypothetical protein
MIHFGWFSGVLGLSPAKQALKTGWAQPFLKPEPRKAKPKPGLLSPAQPAHHYLRLTDRTSLQIKERGQDLENIDIDLGNR